MIDQAVSAFFHLLGHSRTLGRAATRYGLRTPTSFARRFIAGETIEDAIAAARAVEARGLLHTLDHLGEGVTSVAEAEIATRAYLRIVDAIRLAGIGRNVSLKLSQLGLSADRACAVDNLRRVLEKADGFFVRIDMEGSAYTDVTLDVFETLWRQGYRHMGVVLQSDLRRTERDASRMIALGARIRLVKGAYHEPASMAYRRKADVQRSFESLMRLLLTEGHYPAIATHDPEMIAATRRFVAAQRIPLDGFEFQMLYGIRRDLQADLVAAGHRVRVYIPFGRDWYPYVMRRLAERPANVAFVLRGVLGERSDKGR
jgi:proline dehydrogenase